LCAPNDPYSCPGRMRARDGRFAGLTPVVCVQHDASRLRTAKTSPEAPALFCMLCGPTTTSSTPPRLPDWGDAPPPPRTPPREAHYRARLAGPRGTGRRWVTAATAASSAYLGRTAQTAGARTAVLRRAHCHYTHPRRPPPVWLPSELVRAVSRNCRRRHRRRARGRRVEVVSSLRPSVTAASCSFSPPPSLPPPLLPLQ